MEILKINGDYHTHTTYSHGKGTPEENVKRAIELGLDNIAVTDHGYGHVIFGASRKSIVKQSSEVRALKSKYPQINIFMGIEANLRGIDGTVDLTERDYEELDIILCGFHKPVLAQKFGDYFKLFYNSYSHRVYAPTKSQIKNNTAAYVNLIKNNKIDILTHINYHLKVDCRQVAKACSDYGTYLELSSRHSDCSEKDYEDIFATDVKTVINSDAHKVSDIGNWDKALSVVSKYNLGADRIANAGGGVLSLRSKR